MIILSSAENTSFSSSVKRGPMGTELDRALGWSSEAYVLVPAQSEKWKC